MKLLIDISIAHIASLFVYATTTWAYTSVDGIKHRCAVTYITRIDNLTDN